MSANTFGERFRVTTFGESHGGAVGVVIDGCPPGLVLSEEDIQPELDRRKPGQSSITTPRKEEDIISIHSGVFEGKTTGTPIMMLARNNNTRSEDYDHLKSLYRPSHADFTYQAKYGLRDFRGSGRASARETLARVAAGAVAQKFLRLNHNVTFVSYVQSVGDIRTQISPALVMRESIDSNIVRCPDGSVAEAMQRLIEQVRDEQDSIGGIICGVIRGLPAGLGEPVFDKFHAELGKAMLSINAVKGFEIGSGFFGTTMRGSQHNDPFGVATNGGIEPKTNHAGGVLGGITTGTEVIFRVAFKPVATIGKEQQTVTLDGKAVTLKAAGRHDPCVLPRAVPIVDAMASLVVMDQILKERGFRG